MFYRNTWRITEVVRVRFSKGILGEIAEPQEIEELLR